jgi:high-affinity iron transporter
MLAAFVIVFREMIEAGLILGIVLTATRTTPNRGRWVALGTCCGVLGACLLALFADKIGSLFEGAGQELFNAVILLIAVGMLIWHNVWMSVHGRELAKNLRQVGADVTDGRRTLAALSTVVGIAVLREGSEVVLFLYGIMASGGTSMTVMLLGGALGVLGGGIISALMYFGLLRIPARHLFSVTTGLISLMAAGLAAQAVAFLQQAGYFSFGNGIVWNSSRILSQNSLVGRLLHTLLGYSDAPTRLQLGAYTLILLLMYFLTTAVKLRQSHVPARVKS